MKLSRLSDRQLRRLVRNAEVRFGDNEFEEYASKSRATKSRVTQEFKALTTEILKFLRKRGIFDKVRREFDDFKNSRENMYKAWGALSSKIWEIEKSNK